MEINEYDQNPYLLLLNEVQQALNSCTPVTRETSALGAQKRRCLLKETD